MSLVDLAGSESVGRTQAVGPRLAEANSINKSLLSLGQVVTGICQRKNHIKYRDNTLTKVLKESLNGASCVTMIACKLTMSYMLLLLSKQCNALSHFRYQSG